MMLKYAYQDIAYSKLANLDPQYALCEFPCFSQLKIFDFLLYIIPYSINNWCGLLSTFFFPDSDFVPPLIYASMGSSRHIVIGPVSLVSLMLGNMLLNEIDPSDKHAYRRLAFTATFFAGITQFALGFLRYVCCLHIKESTLAPFHSYKDFKVISKLKWWLCHCFQIGFLDWLFVSRCHRWLHVWICHYHSPSTAQRFSRYKILY